MRLSDDVTKIKGIGPKLRSLFNKLNIYTAGDLLNHFPRSYVRLEEPKALALLRDNEAAAVTGEIQRVESVRTRAGRIMTNAYVADENGRVLVCSWYNMPYLKNSLPKHTELVFNGKISIKGGRIYMQQPRTYSIDEYDRQRRTLQPIYSLTAGLNSRQLRSAIEYVMENIDADRELAEYLPDDIIRRYSFMPRRTAYYKIHFSGNTSELSAARSRLAFDEFFIFLARLAQLKENNAGQPNINPMPKAALAAKVISGLKFKLTEAQEAALADILKDLVSDKPMNRLLQGDVGSGKTIVAALAMLTAYENGYQSAIMAPTEVLAAQHFEYISGLIAENKLKCRAVLLTGSMSAAQKKEAYSDITAGRADLVIGTHALIQDKVSFDKPGLVITDEQHRFGVKQRDRLSDKGRAVHTLTMSATPIPRTLAIMLYGDLDISVINMLPSDRLPIKNAILNEGHRKAAYELMLQQINRGRQCYIICPMIDEGEDDSLKNVVEYTETLKRALPAAVRISTLHGDMTAAEKNAVMNDFKSCKIDILVSTTVIEVGVNVPNATVIMIENADRFGLAQLHQLRGRVGRGEHQSYAMFMSGSDSDTAVKRLEVLKKSNDGFYIAQEDLRLRGPGELFGFKQSGELSFRIADIYNDREWLEAAAAEVAVLKGRGLHRLSIPDMY